MTTEYADILYSQSIYRVIPTCPVNQLRLATSQSADSLAGNGRSLVQSIRRRRESCRSALVEEQSGEPQDVKKPVSEYRAG